MTTHHRAKRILLTGAGGVGKTSLAARLAPALDIPLLPESARQVCQELGYENPAAVPDQSKFRQALLNWQIARELEIDQYVADRGTPDIWVMWQRWQMCSAMTYESEAIYQTCREHANRYTHIIYIPPLFEPEDDQFRWTDKDYIKQIDRLTRTTLYDWCLLDRTYTIGSADIESRVNEVCHWLQTK